jgi:hypothetical protein
MKAANETYNSVFSWHKQLHPLKRLEREALLVPGEGARLQLGQQGASRAARTEEKQYTGRGEDMQGASRASGGHRTSSIMGGRQDVHRPLDAVLHDMAARGLQLIW